MSGEQPSEAEGDLLGTHGRESPYNDQALGLRARPVPQIPAVSILRSVLLRRPRGVYTAFLNLDNPSSSDALGVVQAAAWALVQDVYDE